MEEQELNFFFENTAELDLDHLLYQEWIHSILDSFQKELVCLNYIFCDDEYLLAVNQEYLDHDYYTDIITFDNSDDVNSIEGDIFISIDRVRENAVTNQINFTHELNRVISHGLLHLIGFDDKTEEEKKEMRKKEDACLSLLAK